MTRYVSVLSQGVQNGLRGTLDSGVISLVGVQDKFIIRSIYANVWRDDGLAPIDFVRYQASQTNSAQINVQGSSTLPVNTNTKLDMMYSIQNANLPTVQVLAEFSTALAMAAVMCSIEVVIEYELVG
jgi:hypothetical protein